MFFIEVKNIKMDKKNLFIGVGGFIVFEVKRDLLLKLVY